MMDPKAFEEHGSQLLKFVTSYLENIRDRDVYPNVSPGFMRPLIPERAPESGEDWEALYGNIDRIIMPGVSLLRVNE